MNKYLLTLTYSLGLCVGLILSPKALAQLTQDNNVKFVQIIANDTLRFDDIEIDVTPGQKIHVQLRNEGTLPKESMGHNWVLLDSSSEANTYAMAAMTARASEYKPKALESQVLASIPLLGPKETGDTTFNAPTKPGKYPFICSCSGHSLAGMKGYVVVKPVP